MFCSRCQVVKRLASGAPGYGRCFDPGRGGRRGRAGDPFSRPPTGAKRSKPWSLLLSADPCSRNLQPNSIVRLLLAFDALILGHLQGLSPEYGILICGPAFKRIRVHLSDCRESLAEVLTRLRLQVASFEAPPLALNQ